MDTDEGCAGVGCSIVVLSLGLVNDARLANSLLKLFDERLSAESADGEELLPDVL